MIMSELIQQAVAKTGLHPMDSVPTDLYNLAKGFLNRMYEDVWTSYPFRDEKLLGVSVSLVSGTSEVMLPQEVDLIRAVRSSTDDPVFAFGEVFLNDFAPEAFVDTGNPTRFYNLADSPVETQPAAASVVTVVSDSTADVSLTLRVFGLSSNTEVYEDFELNGVNTVTGTTTFDADDGIVSISKPLTTGRITVKDASANTLGTIPAWANQGRYRRIRVYPIPDDDYTLTIQATRRFAQLTSDSDTILLRRAENSIFALLCAELYEYSGQQAMADLERAKAGAMIERVVNREEFQDAEDTRSFPASGMFGDDYYPIDTSFTGTHHAY